MRRATLILALLWGSLASAQYVPSTLAAQQHGGGGVAPSNFAHIAGSTTGCYDLSTSRTNCAAPTHTNPVAGHARLISVTWHDSVNTLTASVASSNGDVWASITPGKVFATSAGFSVQNFSVFSSGGGADTITVTISSATTFISFLEDEYSYTGTLSGFDGTPVLAGITPSGGVGTTPSVTTTNASDLLWATCPFASATCTAGAGWTARNDTNACQFDTGTCVNGNDYNGTLGQLNEDKVGVAAGTYTATFASSGTADVLGLVPL
jgi:hypothetical protein